MTTIYYPNINLFKRKGVSRESFQFETRQHNTFNEELMLLLNKYLTQTHIFKSKQILSKQLDKGSIYFQMTLWSANEQTELGVVVEQDFFALSQGMYTI